MSETCAIFTHHFGARLRLVLHHAQDGTYGAGPRLAALAGHLSINQDLYLEPGGEVPPSASEQARTGALATCCPRSLLLGCGPSGWLPLETFSVPDLTSGSAAASLTLWASAVSPNTR